MDRHLKIYIAKGDDLLGPYDPAEAETLLKSGYLKPTDFAARDGDPAWVPLLQLVPVEASLLPGATPAAPPTPPVAADPPPAAPDPAQPRSFAWPVRLAGLVLALLLVAALFARWERSHRLPAPHVAESLPAPAKATPTSSSPPSPPPPRAQPTNVAAASPSPLPTPTAPPLAAASPAPASPPPVTTPPLVALLSPSITPAPAPSPAPSAPPTPPANPACRLAGTLSLAGPAGQPVPLAGARVAAYSSDSLAAFLAAKKAHVQAELDRLAPQLAAAEADRRAKLGEEQETRQAYLDASPRDPLLGSLYFAATQAKAAADSARTDYQYLLTERKEAMDGAFYFRDLPPPAVETRTSPAGRYELAFPAGGTVVVAASVQQPTASGTHPRYWLVQVTLANGETHPLPLSEANVSSAPSPDSLLQTAD